MSQEGSDAKSAAATAVRQSETASSAGATNPRFPLFDSLRAIAALSIFVLHIPLVLSLSPDNAAKPYLLELRVGVSVFFLISGFLLYRPFARARYLGEPRPATIPYGWRRALRIIPAYWVALFFTALLLSKSGGLGKPIAVFSPRGVVSYFGFLQVYDPKTLLGGITAAWSLCLEVIFYAMLPLWALLLRRIACRTPREFLRSELLALGALFVIGAVWVTVAATAHPPTAATILDLTHVSIWLWVLPAYFDQFALGMALAVLSVALVDRASPPSAVRVIDRAPWLPWLVAAITFFLLGNVAGWFEGSASAQWIVTHELQGIFAFALLLPAAFGDPDRGLVRRVLANRALLWIGLVSYGVYLWHVLVLTKLDDAGLEDTLGSVAYVALALGLTLAVAAASFYGVERHALRLGRRLSHRRRSQDADERMHDLASHERPQTGQ